MKLQRPISTWMKCNPKEMAKMSPAAIQFAFEDAIKDIEKLSRLLCIAAYPRLGTDEHCLNIVQYAGIVAGTISYKEAQELQ